MPARNVSLTDHLAEFVDQNVSSGVYQNASEVVRAGLRLLEQSQQERAAKLEALRSAVRVGLEAAERGDLVEVAEGGEFEFVHALGRAGAED